MIVFLYRPCQNRHAPFEAKENILHGVHEVRFFCDPVKQHHVELQAEASESVLSTRVAQDSSYGLASAATEFAVSQTPLLECNHDGNSCSLESATASFAKERIASTSRSLSTGPTGPTSRFNSTSLSHRAAAKDADSGRSLFQLRSAVPAAPRLVERLHAPPPPQDPPSLASSSTTRRPSTTAIPSPLYSRRAGLRVDALQRHAPDSRAPATLHEDFTVDMDLSSSSSPRSTSSQAGLTRARLIHRRPEPPAGTCVSGAGWSTAGPQPLPGVEPHRPLSIGSPAPEHESMDCGEAPCDDSCQGGGGSSGSRGDDWMDLFTAWEEDGSVPAQGSLRPAPGMLLVSTSAAFLLLLRSYSLLPFPRLESCSPL
jgi:hypothetical protein